MAQSDHIAQTGAASGKNHLKRAEFALVALGLGCLAGYARMASVGFVGYLSPAGAPSVDPWYALRTAACLATLALNGWRKMLSVSVPSLIFATAAAIAAPIVFAVSEGGELASGFWGESGTMPPASVAATGGFAVAVLTGTSAATCPC